MGLLKHLLFWPVTGPSFLTRFSLEKVEGAVRTELTDDTAVKRDLMELQMELELGDIDDEEYIRREALLMRRLREVRGWKQTFGMPTSGGLVRVADDARADDGAPDEARDDGDDRDDAARSTPAEEAGPDGDPGDGDAGSDGPRVARPGGAEVDISFGFDED